MSLFGSSKDDMFCDLMRENIRQDAALNSLEGKVDNLIHLINHLGKEHYTRLYPNGYEDWVSLFRLYTRKGKS